MARSHHVCSEPQQIGEICAEWLSGLVERIELRRKRDFMFNIIRRDDERKWGAIRALYKTIDTNDYDPYPVDWTQIFSPIEDMAWGEIRANMLPFWPQYPIGNYFADFANPIKKIVIECDGRAFHSRAKDKARDQYMNDCGWRVYRISGADCNRILPSPWEAIGDMGMEEDCVEAERLIREWMHSTVDGLIVSIAMVHFARPYVKSDFFRSEASHVLSARLARGF